MNVPADAACAPPRRNEDHRRHGGVEEGFGDFTGGGGEAAGGVEQDDCDFDLFVLALLHDAGDVALGDGVDDAVHVGDEGRAARRSLGEGEARQPQKE